MFKVTLREKKSPHMLERHPRYDVLLGGEKVSEIYYNMNGYRGAIPSWRGGMFDPGEIAISGWKKEVALMNRQAREALEAAKTAQERIYRVSESDDPDVLLAFCERQPPSGTKEEPHQRQIGVYRSEWANFRALSDSADGIPIAPDVLLFEELEMPGPWLNSPQPGHINETHVRSLIAESMSLATLEEDGVKTKMWHVSSSLTQHLMIGVPDNPDGVDDVIWKWRSLEGLGAWSGLTGSGSLEDFVETVLEPEIMVGARTSGGLDRAITRVSFEPEEDQDGMSP